MGNKRETFYYGHWLTGYTDGNGTFSIDNNKKIILTFKISQKNNNSQVLHFFKKLLNCGKVVNFERTMSSYLVRDQSSLKNIIIPFFETYPLVTSKRHEFQRFKQALEIATNPTIKQKDKITLINKLKHEMVVKPPITKSWVVGFVEANGNFYITRKSLVHGFAISQKKDKDVLERIVEELGIKADVRWNKKGFYVLDTTNSSNIKTIKNYFFNTMKSRKSLVYRIWARTLKHKGKHERLLKIQSLLRSLK